jgi:hypothetical protein
MILCALLTRLDARLVEFIAKLRHLLLQRLYRACLRRELTQKKSDNPSVGAIPYRLRLRQRVKRSVQRAPYRHRERPDHLTTRDDRHSAQVVRGVEMAEIARHSVLDGK